MDRKVQKVINKLINYGDSNLRCFEKENNLDLHLVVKSIILSHFKQVSFDDDILADDKSDVNILFLDPSKILNALSDIYTNVKEQIAFLEWYLNRLVLFYATKPLERYEKMGEILAYKINTYLGIAKNNSSTNNKKEITYDRYREICEKMKKLYQGGVLYTQQYELLTNLGMAQHLVNQIKDYQVSSLLNSCVIPKIEEIEKQEDNKWDESSIAFDSPIKQENIISHRSVKDKLNEYLDLSNLQNKVIIEGDVFLKVDSLLKKIYPNGKIIYIEKRICINNKIMRQEKFERAKEVLFSEENLCYFQYITAIAYNEDTRFISYMPLIAKTRDEILRMLEEFINLEKEEQEILKEAYQEQIQFSLERLKEYGVSLAEDFEIKR